MFVRLQKYYLVLSLILFSLSLVGGIILVQRNQDLRNLAAPSCPSGKVATACNRTCNGGCVNARCCLPDGSNCENVDWENDSCCGGTTSADCGSGQCNNQTNRPDYECSGKSNCRCTSTCYWLTGGTCNEGCNQVTCDKGDGCTISCDQNGGPASCGSSTSPGGKNNDRNSGCPAAPTSPATGAKCPNDGSLTIKKYVKFTCPNGCPVTTEQGVTAGRCYENRQESTGPISLNGACGQVDALSGDADGTFCGTTEYNCTGPCLRQPTSPPAATSTPIPTATRIPSATPTGTRVPTLTPTATRVPSSTPTPTRGPTSTPGPSQTPTSTPRPTSTPHSLSCGDTTCNQENHQCQEGLVCLTLSNGSYRCTMPEYQDACYANPSTSSCCQAPAPTTTTRPTSTPKPTSTPVYIAQGPTPTRIVLPNAGFDLPIKGLTIVGTIVTLLGLLILL